MISYETHKIDVGPKRLRAVDVRPNGEWVVVLQEGEFSDLRRLQQTQADATPQRAPATIWSVIRSIVSNQDKPENDPESVIEIMTAAWCVRAS